MKEEAIFERDFLYPTQKPFEPGCVHVSVYPPKQMGSLPVIIEAKTTHNPLHYIPDIIAILQADVFDRIRIDIKSNGNIYFKKDQNYYQVKFAQKGKYSIEEIQQPAL